mmetsp:Transcript_2769/g.2780  ORF Transcript_2769/g.2780 Transcript_2769/m.2780 type:complete len:118 (+) Transcript_2769:69-422(+)
MLRTKVSRILGPRSKRGSFRMFLPQMPLTLLSATEPTSASPFAKATFRILPRMTKHEVKEYLGKIYGLPVFKVNTLNFAGKRKRIMTKTKMISYKQRDWKKAFVTFKSSVRSLGAKL